MYFFNAIHFTVSHLYVRFFLSFSLFFAPLPTHHLIIYISCRITSCIGWPRMMERSMAFFGMNKLLLCWFFFNFEIYDLRFVHFISKDRRYYFRKIAGVFFFSQALSIFRHRSDRTFPRTSLRTYLRFIILLLLVIAWSRINAAAAAAAAIAIGSNSNEYAWQMSQLWLQSVLPLLSSRIKLWKFWLARWDRSSNSLSLEGRHFHTLSLSIISK